MKILMVNKFLFSKGGSETYIFKLGERLASLGHEVQYFGMDSDDRIVGNKAEQYTSNMDFHGGSKLAKLTYPLKTIYSSEAKKKISIVLEDFQPDIVHLNNFNYQLTPSIIYAVDSYRRKSGRDVRLVYTAHDAQLVCPNHMLLDTRGSLCTDCIGGHFMSCTKKGCVHGSRAKSLIATTEATLYKALGAYKKLDKIICCSEFMKEMLDTYPALSDKTAALHNFIDKSAPDNVSKGDYVLYFGRFSEEKGIGTLIEAAKMLPDVKFIFAGSGPLEDELIAVENIECVGFKTGQELDDLIANARLSVYPSIWYENCPFSVMESISLGTPVIASKIGGIPELINDNANGMLFEAGNANALRECIETLFSDRSLCDRLTEGCGESTYYTIDEYIEKYFEIING